MQKSEHFNKVFILTKEISSLLPGQRADVAMKALVTNVEALVNNFSVDNDRVATFNDISKYFKELAKEAKNERI